MINGIYVAMEMLRHVKDACSLGVWDDRRLVEARLSRRQA